MTGGDTRKLNRRLGVIGAPTSAGAFGPGQEKAPGALRQARLLEQLRDQGLVVVDHGDIPEWRWRPDPGRPLAQNLDAVILNGRAVADRVRAALADDELVLVLGGDCTVEIGTVSGHLPTDERIGLIYFDLHPDLNVPGSQSSGALDWMGLAHMLGEEDATAELRGIGPREPLLGDDQVILFAQGIEQTRPWELEVIARRSLETISVEQVASDPEGAAAAALERAEREWDRILVHFDVDTVDFTDAPLSENTGRNIGLALDMAFQALERLLRSPRLSALTITELNPDHGAADGSTLDSFVEGLVECLAGAADLKLQRSC